jgi:hypothetical protein
MTVSSIPAESQSFEPVSIPAKRFAIDWHESHDGKAQLKGMKNAR